MGEVGPLHCNGLIHPACRWDFHDLSDHVKPVTQPPSQPSLDWEDKDYLQRDKYSLPMWQLHGWKIHSHVMGLKSGDFTESLILLQHGLCICIDKALVYPCEGLLQHCWKACNFVVSLGTMLQAQINYFENNCCICNIVVLLATMLQAQIIFLDKYFFIWWVVKFDLL